MRTIIAAVTLFIWIWAATAWSEERKMILSLEAGEQYNDNIFFGSDDEVDDYITSLMGGIRLLNRSERLELRASGQVENFDYADNDAFDGLDQNYTGYLGYILTPNLKASINAGFSQDTQPDRDIDITGQLMSSATRDSWKYGFDTQWAMNEITSASLAYRYTDQQFDGDEYVDYRYHNVGVGLARKMDRVFFNTTGRFNVTYAQYDYPSAQIDYYSGTIGFLRKLNEIWHLQIDVGARFTESTFQVLANEYSNDGWGGVGSLEFGYHGEYATTNLTFSHDVGATSGENGSVERTSVLMNFSYRLDEEIRGGLITSYHINLADAGDLSLEDTDENTLNLRPFLHFGFWDRFWLEASYTYTQLQDNISDKTRERNLCLVKLGFEYPFVE